MARTPSRISTPTAKSKGTATIRVSQHALRIIELMLKEMRQGMENPSLATTEGWERVFGTKESMVANLQKLIQALAALPDGTGDIDVAGRKGTETLPMTAEEMAMLKAWLGEVKEG